MSPQMLAVAVCVPWEAGVEHLGERNGAPWVSGTQCTQGQPGRDPRQAAPVHPLPENVPQGAGGERGAPGVLTPRGGPAVRSGQAQGSGQWSGPTALSRLQCEDSASHRAALGAQRQKPARRPAQSVCSWTAGRGGGRTWGRPDVCHPLPCRMALWETRLGTHKGVGTQDVRGLQRGKEGGRGQSGFSMGRGTWVPWGLGGASLTPRALGSP